MKGSQEKIGLLSVKMEQGTDPCLKLPRSSAPSHPELASAQKALQGDETVGNVVIPLDFQLRETL